MTESEIEDLVRRHPLPDGVPDAVLNRSELSEFFRVSPMTVSAWINAGMPVLRQGGQGREYEFSAAACWAWKSARDRQEEARGEEARAAITAMRLALVGGRRGDSIEALDPKTRREIIAAQREFEAFERDRGALLRREEVGEAFEVLMVLVRDTLETAPDRVERVADMPPRAVDELVAVCDGLLAEFRAKIEAWIAARPLRPDAPTSSRKDLFE